ncbi:DUF1273 family protein [Lactobacillus sp. W8092]|nr:DUF1273 family protein [Lactobacillus sp. W8092]
MKSITNLWVTGYRAYELGIFTANDPKIKIITTYLTRTLQNYCEHGLKWVLTGGQLGVEQYVVQAVKQPVLAPYQLQVAILLPFQNMQQRWNEKNQQIFFQTLQRADFCQILSPQPYQNPRQFQTWQSFMLHHTQGSLLVYDPEYPGKTKYEYQAIQQYQAHVPYDLQLIDMYDLQDFVDDQQSF